MQNLRFRLPYGARLFLRLHWALLTSDTVAAVSGAVAGVLLALGLAWLVGGAVQGWGIVLPVVLGYLGYLAGGLAYLGYVLLRKLPANYYGMCTGYTAASGGPAVLTDWLHTQINTLAGRSAQDPPLTFGDLRAKPRIDGHDVCITFKMVTTNLSQGQPYVFPLDNHLLLFHEDDMAQFFPPTVVTHLVTYASRKAIKLPDKVHFLPAGDDLPIVVATRMSLSFPILLSAVRLSTIRDATWKQHHDDPAYQFALSDLQENWFSDGGISSNFPIHMFDAWLPTRPTFGIKLTALPAEVFEPGKRSLKPEHCSASARQSSDGLPSPSEPTGGDGVRPIEAVFLPRPSEDAGSQWLKLDGLVAFIWSIFTTAQNYRDNTQAQLPSYRERIVQIRFDKDEGGLNLAMDDATIQTIAAKGSEAGHKLLAFGTSGFPEHQWVRMRVLMDQLERELTIVKKSLADEGECARAADDRSYTEEFAKLHERYELLIEAQLAQRQQGDAAAWYCAEDDDWCRQALECIKALVRLIHQWDSALIAWRKTHPDQDEFFPSNAPLPESILRVTPEL
jgi:hypothetical protein